MPFTFKQFHINDSLCGMRVSTDSVLLGAWAPLRKAHRILDIGAGSGILSLMAAQRSKAQITAIELDKNAIEDCEYNFKASPWADRLRIHHISIQCFADKQASFDHIICNPPYFTQGPQSKSSARSTARHTDTLQFSELLSSIKKCLSQQGCASLILPSESLPDFLSKIIHFQLQLTHIVDVCSVEGKAPNRHLINLEHANLQNQPFPFSRTHLNIRTKEGEYTEKMRTLTQGFYLKL
ncbi:methyltransferase [uncultured Shewanella sp.]|uniref:tRNA1(Val) (adenine(37)-N6)-methyltransferase n=1 Tax=uncultured Shewanella sp. TaxID=173975 RepID=UPI0026222C5A|nr:methyltransferase [uncultured Shewanella sp.]